MGRILQTLLYRGLMQLFKLLKYGKYGTLYTCNNFEEFAVIFQCSHAGECIGEKSVFRSISDVQLQHFVFYTGAHISFSQWTSGKLHFPSLWFTKLVHSLNAQDI